MNWYKKAFNALNLLSSSEEDLKTAFDLMEGNGFYNYSNNKPEYSIQSVKKELIKLIKEKNDFFERTGEWMNATEETIKMFEDDFKDETLTIGVSIYGSGGINRYFVKKNGDILFSRMHGDKKTTQNAQDLGFEIF